MPATIQHLEGAELLPKAVLGEPFSLPGLHSFLAASYATATTVTAR